MSPITQFAKYILPVLLLVLLAIIGILASQRTPMPVLKGDSLNGPESNYTNKQTLRIGTYNIHQGENLQGHNSLNEVTQVLHKAELDVIALNEVGGNLLGTLNQAEEIANILGMGWLFAPTRRKDFVANFGNALLSRVDVHDYSIEPLIWQRNENNVIHQSNANRNMIISKFMFAGEEVTLIVTHLDRGPLRTEQLQDVLKLFKQHSPAILIGDLNSTYDDEAISMGIKQGDFRDALADFDHAGRLDWIMVRGLSVLACGTHPAGPSDHPHYWVELALEYNALSVARQP